MKKAISLLLTLVMALTLCGTVFAEGEYSEHFDIDWIGWTGPCDNDGVVVQYVNEKFNVTINMWNTLGEALNTRIGAGEIPDVIVLWKGFIPTYADQGIITEVPWELIEEVAPDLYKAYVDNMASYMSAATYDGVNWGLPIQATGSGGLMNPIIYRGDWMKNVGIEKTPETLAELEDLVYKFTFNDPDGNGKNDTYGISASMMDAVYGAFGTQPGMYLDGEDGKVFYGSVHPGMKEALTILRKWIVDGVVDPEWVLGENSTMYMTSTPFLNGVIGSTCHTWRNYMNPITPDGCGYKLTNFPEATCEIGYAPVGPNGDSGVFTLGYLQDNIIAFGIQLADQPEKLKRILEIYNWCSGTVEGYVITNFGFEGQQWDYIDYVDWKGNACKIPSLREEYKVWAARVAIGAGCEINNACYFPSIQGQVLPDSGYLYTDLPWLTKSGYMASAKTYIPCPEAEEYGNELDLLENEYITKILLGERPIDDFDEFVTRWYAEGGQKVLDAYNAR